MPGKVLILGATGRFGRHAAEAFWNAGWGVSVFERGKDDLMEAAAGVDVIVNGWNPLYPSWEKTVPALTAEVIQAASAHGATVIVPGNVYVYGKDAPERLESSTPHGANNSLGRIRIEMEAAYRASGVRTIILRGGDFIDTEASGNWFDEVIISKLDKGVVTLPGPANAMHAWAYLPDMAQAAVALAERRESLGTFTDVGFPGYALTLGQMAEQIARATGVEVRTRAFPWWQLIPAIPFWTMGRRLFEMRYLWSLPHRIESAEFDALLPDFRPTDPVVALARAVRHKVHPKDAMPRGAAHLAAE